MSPLSSMWQSIETLTTLLSRATNARVVSLTARRFDALILSHLARSVRAPVSATSPPILPALAVLGLHESGERPFTGAPHVDIVGALHPLLEARGKGLKFLQFRTGHGLEIEKLQGLDGVMAQAGGVLEELHLTVKVDVFDIADYIALEELEAWTAPGHESEVRPSVAAFHLHHSLTPLHAVLALRYPNDDDRDPSIRHASRPLGPASARVLPGQPATPFQFLPYCQPNFSSLQNPILRELRHTPSLTSLSVGFGFAPAESTAFMPATVLLANTLPELRYVRW